MVKTDKKAPKKTGSNILEQANMVHALAYIPYGVWAIAMFFLALSDKNKAMHHIKYSGIIAVAAILGHVLLNGSFIGWLIFPAYIAGSAYLGWKAYNGEEVTIELLDSVEEKIEGAVKKK